MVNIYNLFKFLEDKKGKPIPFGAKLIYTPDELTDEDLNVEGDLDLSSSKITSLPDNLQVGGSLYLAYSNQITSLPDNLQVGEYLNLFNTPITSLPDNLKVGGSLDLRGTPLADKYSKEQIKKMIEEKGGEVEGEIYT